MERVEIGNAVDAQGDGFTIDDRVYSEITGQPLMGGRY
jgi:hypothetical protein